MKRKLFLVFFVIIVASNVLNAKVHSNAGKSGFQFLKLPVSPGLAAMANTGEMFHSSPLTIFHHPAAFKWQRGTTIAFSQTQWLVDTHMYNIAYRNVTLARSFGIGVVYMDHGKFDKRVENGDLVGNYYPMDLRATANYAFRLTPNIHLGANLNLLYEKIDTFSALGFSTDIGYVYLTPIRNTAFDFAVKNIGSSSKMDSEKIELPFIAEAGFSTGFDPNEFFAVYPSFKIAYMNDYDNLIPAIGVKTEIYDMLFLRAGYKVNYNEEDFSAGFGIHLNKINIDYSYLNSDISSIHMFGVEWEF